MVKPMRNLTHSPTVFRRLSKRFTGAAVLATAAALLAGCSGAASADVSSEGQLTYACSLAEHIQEEPSGLEQRDDYVGDDANPAVREAASIGMFAVASEDPDFTVTGQNLAAAISRIDTEMLTSGLTEIQEACDSADIPTNADVSHEAQLDYACALVARLNEENDDVAALATEEGPAARYEALAAASLAGAFNGQTLAEAPELSAAGRELMRAIQLRDADAVGQHLEAFEAACTED